MVKIEMSAADLDDVARMLDAFATMLDRDDLARAVPAQLAEELGDVGGARYASTGHRAVGPMFVAERSRELSKRLRSATR